MATIPNQAALSVDEAALFVSDIHLCASRPLISEAFILFLAQVASQYPQLFILGDLFEYWAGDDDIEDDFNANICQAIKQLSDTGTQVYFVCGNRDFLIGESFAKQCGLTLLDDPTIIQHQGQSILLSHGDALCTDDHAYQAMRKQFRETTWQQQFLQQPLSARKAQIADIRAQSESAKAEKSMMIMDVNAAAVAALLRKHDYPSQLIHGHTHRPDTHTLTVDSHVIKRHVLGDWYEQGSYLVLSKDGIQSQPLANTP